MDTLGKLSNNELRLKCLEYGLPNVPVTDSSRKLLEKRLNDAINNTAPKETTKSNRRETINIVKAPSVELESVQKNRRTISAAAIAKEEAPTAIPVSTRRRSVQKDVTESNRQAKDVVRPMDSILIEDDEDDIALLNAAENAEKASTTSSVPIENITATRRKSRSVSVPKMPEIKTAVTKQRTMTPLIEDMLEFGKQEAAAKTAKPQAVANEKIVNILSVQQLPPIESPIELTQKMKTYAEPLHYSMQSATPSVYSTPSVHYTIGSSTATAGGNYLSGSSQTAHRSKYLTDFNELSDTDATNDDGCKSPFLSTFARDLERRHSVGRSTTTVSGYGSYARRPGTSNYEKTAIRGRRSSKADLSMGQVMLALGRKYHLKTIFYLLVLICIAIFIYVYLYA